MSCGELETRHVQFATCASGTDDDALALELQSSGGRDPVWIDKMHSAGSFVDCHFSVKEIFSKR